MPDKNKQGRIFLLDRAKAQQTGTIWLSVFQEEKTVRDLVSGKNLTNPGGFSIDEGGSVATFNGAQQQNIAFVVPVLNNTIIAARVKATAAQAANPGAAFGIYASSGVQSGFGVGFDTANSVGCTYIDNSGAGTLARSAGSLNKWYTVFVQHLDNNSTYAWINGKPATTGQGSTHPTAFSTINEISIGAQHRSSGFLRQFKGNIEWAAILNLPVGANNVLTDDYAEYLYESNYPYSLEAKPSRIWVAAAGGDVTLPLGFVTETDSANSIASAKSRAIGQVSESDSVIGIGASKSVTLGLNVETNQAQAIALAKSAGLGITTETDTSFALSRAKLATIGQQTEADSANAVARSKTVTLGIVVEADSAPSLGAGVSVAIGQVVESDTAQAISKAKSKALSQVVESDSVPTIAATKTLALGLVTEIDTPLALAQASGITLGLVTESDIAPAISVTKVKVLGQVTEANTVAGIAKAKSATIGQVIEADTANPLVGNLVAVLGLVTEVEFAHSISLLKSRGLLQVTEANSVFGLTKDKVAYISQVVEVDQVFSVFSKIDYRFVESGYNTLSINPAYNKMYIDPNYH